ncbi:carbon starvation CstA family protein [Legionella dresdenensis]|uniref:Carbon starvation CstA family protein n=1 Tax=Legionella dresdenensis TaxID=450200 RepID=A0ABV8CEX5_9GAMM
MIRLFKRFIWLAIAVTGAALLGGIAVNRGETINAMWFIVAALCVYTLAYRFYAAWIAAKVLVIDSNRATPAVRFDNGRDFVPTNKWVVFGHHFAAIAGPGPLVGPTLAAQFGYLPGTLWILFGAVLGGCVQDMVTLFLSTRHDGKSLGQIAREQLGRLGGAAAMIATFAIMIILIAVLGLVVVNAMKHSPWGASTVAATIPIAMIIGIYMRHIRPGRVLEASTIGVVLLVLSVIGGSWISNNPALKGFFNHDGLTLAYSVIAYGLAAAILPVWLLLAPRDYLSTFVKLGTIALLAIAILILNPPLKMPALTPFINGAGPIFGGKLFPFVFITIACGAISGFHALIASGTTPKLLTNERDIRMIGYGSMLLESFVALMAMIAATVLEPGVFFAINTPAGVLPPETAMVLAKLFPVSAEHMQALARQMGEASLYARTGGAPSLAVGMASILGSAFGEHLLALWYHFAIMFEAIFILTTLDAGTRVGRFMLQDILGNIWPKMGQTSWMPSVVLTSSLVVAGWGYFLYIGVIDPHGGVNILWPMFGIANQMLAAIALSVATGVLVKTNKLKYAWVTGLPLLWLLIITTTAAWEKVTSDDIRIGFLAAANDLSGKLAVGMLSPEKSSIASQLIFNLKLDACLTIAFIALLWMIVFDMLRISALHIWRSYNLPTVSSCRAG